MKEIFKTVLKEIISEGCLVQAGNSLSIGAKRNYYEILNFHAVVDSKTSPLLPFKVPNFNIYLAIGRLLWMLRGSNNLAEMEYYDKKVSYFSDDGLIIPGSSFGHRIFSKNGNQLKQIIQRLKSDHSSRRCVINIYDSTDNFRQSKDIPCLLFLAFHIRENRLNLTIQMRSNNAFRLFLYNFFELSFLLNFVSSELRIESGSVFYNALSMHLYVDDKDQAELFLNTSTDINSYSEYPKFSYGEIGESLNKLQNLESFIRSENLQTVLVDFKDKGNEYKETLSGYYDYYLILLHFKFLSSKNQTVLAEIENNIHPFFQNLI